MEKLNKNKNEKPTTCDILVSAFIRPQCRMYMIKLFSLQIYTMFHRKAASKFQFFSFFFHIIYYYMYIYICVACYIFSVLLNVDSGGNRDVLNQSLHR